MTYWDVIRAGMAGALLGGLSPMLTLLEAFSDGLSDPRFGGRSTRSAGSLARAKSAWRMGTLQTALWKTCLWTSIVGAVIGAGAAWYFSGRGTVAVLTEKDCWPVVIGSGVTGLIVGLWFLGFVCFPGEADSTPGPSATPKPPRLTHPGHYDLAAREAYGKSCAMSLVQASMEGSFITLVYRWRPDLSNDEADRLDTRARAYITCAISDAATTAGLRCDPGPLHGQRPSWRLEGSDAAISLVDAGFDVSDKTCFMQIGAAMTTLNMQKQKGLPFGAELIAGFKARFKEIDV